MKSTALDKVILKIDTPFEMIYHKFNKIVHGVETANKKKFFNKLVSFKKRYYKKESWDFNGILLPDYPSVPSGVHIYPIFMDTLFVFCKHKDNYNKLLIDKLDEYLPEGTYGYTNDKFDVTVKRDDIVIDAGAWIGDFSAYAVKKGAKVYAFEPSKSTYEILKKTREFNGWFEIIKKGLGNVSGEFYLSNNPNSSSANSITNEITNSEKIEITTIDEYVYSNKLERVDFIKSDIEGYERFMLLGARETIKKYAPKLAICTYHFDDDPIILANLIREINPKYQIVQKKKKLYAMVIKYE